MPALWRLLDRTPHGTDLPPLLISSNFTSNSYAIHVTDLTYLWSESLDRRSIVKRSLDENTSIDPSEDAEQLRVFLDKIQSALVGGGNANTNMTTLALQARPAGSDSRSKEPPDLELHVTAQLPKGLQPLRWSFRLTLLPQAELLAQLTVPSLRAQNARMRELQSLVGVLRDKDHVIQKLVDKLETTGAELGHVFPGAAGKGGRKIPRKQAEERVKGLGVFEVEDWKKEMRSRERENRDGDVKVLLEEVYGGNSSSALNPVTYFEVPRSWHNWWESVRDDPVKLSNKHDTQNSQYETTRASLVQEKDEVSTKEDEDDFQVQATPPNFDKGCTKSTASSPPTLRSQAVIHDSTEDEDGLDAPSQRSIVPDSVPLSPPKQQLRRLGAIGRSKPAPAPVSLPNAPGKTNSPAPDAKPHGKHPIIDDEETASEDESDQQPQVKSPTPAQQPISSPPPLSKTSKVGSSLGKIGGGGARAKEARLQLSPPSPSPPIITTRAAAAAVTTTRAGRSPSPPAPQKPKHKLGVIGGHKKAPPPGPGPAATDPKKATVGNSRGRSVEFPSTKRGDIEMQVEQEVRETSQERADRKRVELKRALEEKAKAPGRKKRKF